MSNKKAQTEVIGLVVVMIIIVIGGLFYIGFGLKSPPKKQSTIEISYASNLLNALLNVKICDNTKQISEAIVDCFNTKDVCGKDACEYVSTEIRDIMERLGVKEFKNYYIYAQIGSQRQDFNKNKDCNADSAGRQVDRDVIGQNNEDYKINLKIC